MTTAKTDIHPILHTLIHLAPAIKKTFFNDVLIAISNREVVLYQSESKEVDTKNSSVGNVLKPSEPMYNVIHSNKPTTMTVGKEYYGIALRLSIVPIHDENNRVIGALGVSRSIKDQSNLQEIAETFAASTEQLSASSSELSDSARGLYDFMKDVRQSQNNLSVQMTESEKILDMINNVAKNTRILGFNAGIEAARSGEHGRGFAVVAKEITKLADQSAESVTEIRNLLDKMKSMVDHVTDTIANSNKLTESQVATTTEIARALEQLSEVAGNIDALAQKL